ncbi:MAG TPA: aspartyl protease family protein [Pseudomonadales bacterium]
MAVLTQTYDPNEGPIVQVTIAAHGSSNGATFPFLLDTGADGSSISSDVISALSLLPIGRVATITTASKQGSVRTFLVDVAIKCDDMTWRKSGLLVAEFLYNKPSIRGLIGRDILCLGDFTMRADHTFDLKLY